MSFAPKIAVVIDNHSLLAIRKSDVEGNISAYLLDYEPCDDEGRVAVYRLLLQGVEVDNVSIRQCRRTNDNLEKRACGHLGYESVSKINQSQTSVPKINQSNTSVPKITNQSQTSGR